MEHAAFDRPQLELVGEALEAAEDLTIGHYKLSFAQWKRYRYDVKTLRALGKNEVSRHAFALLNKGRWPRRGDELREGERDGYFICLQDHRILKALERDHRLRLMPLLVYVFTHELIHIVRFNTFYQRFEASERTRLQEEAVVHATTYEILRRKTLPSMGHILRSYQDHRICDLALETRPPACS